MKKCGLILLAAGASSRMGKPKQLLLYKQQSLLKHSLQIALNSNAVQTIVVTGANVQLIKRELIESDAYSVYNSEWQEGIASSIRCGLSTLIKVVPDVDSALFMVCDQPYITTELLNNLMAKSSMNDSIAASGYDNTLGTPAVFPEKYFSELLILSGDEGAKNVLRQYAHHAAVIPFNDGNIDIDTPIDYDSLPDKF